MSVVHMVETKSISFDECGLNISNGVTIEELKDTLQTLNFTEKNHAYYIGDLLCHLSASKDKEWNAKSNDEKQKESIYKTFLEQNKHSRTSLEHYHKVCKAFTVTERQRFNKRLSFNHFYEALVLTKADKSSAIALLSHAADNNLSLSQTRAFYRSESAEVDNEPAISVSPVVELCAIANELSRKLASTDLSPEESELLLAALVPVITWTDEFTESKSK